MKFWKQLAWLTTAVFIAILLVSWFANAPSAGERAGQELPPAPVFH